MTFDMRNMAKHLCGPPVQTRQKIRHPHPMKTAKASLYWNKGTEFCESFRNRTLSTKNDKSGGWYEHISGLTSLLKDLISQKCVDLGYSLLGTLLSFLLKYFEIEIDYRI